MGYVGPAPTSAKVTSSDITDGTIANADIASDAAIVMSKTALSAGTGLTLSTNTLNVDAAQTGITSVGTIGTGTWQGTAIATGYIADDAITLAKMASGTDGNIISYDASGNPVAIATGSDGQVLTSTGAGSPPAFEAVVGDGFIENADFWRLTGGFNGSENPVTSNWERAASDQADFGEIGTQVYKHDGSTTFDSEIRPSGTFTFPQTGMWLVTAFANCVTASSTADNQSALIIKVSLDADAGTNGDGATYTERAAGFIALYSTTGYGSASCQLIVDVTNKTNVAVQMGIRDQSAGTYSNGSSTANQTGMSFIRLGDT